MFTLKSPTNTKLENLGIFKEAKVQRRVSKIETWEFGGR